MASLQLTSPGAPSDARKSRLKLSQAASEKPSADIVLSSGNFAFAAHCGFLEGVERSLTRDSVNSIVATSSGALAGNKTTRQDLDIAIEQPLNMKHQHLAPYA